MSGDVTYQALKRLSFLPDRDSLDNGSVIAGQEYDDVLFVGGAASNLILTDVVINGVTTARNVTTVTGVGNYTVQAADYLIVIIRNTPEAASVVLPASPTTKRSLIIKDGAGNAGDFNITIDGNGKTLDSISTFLINADWGAVEMEYNGTQWSVLNSYKEVSQGDVVGPNSSADNAITRFDGTTGRVIQNSSASIDDTGNLSARTTTSTVSTGTAPLNISSTTRVSNLNVDRAALADTVTTNANLTGAVTSVGNATSLGSFTSAQLATALTDETGSGANVFATSPALVTPDLGTPTALVGTNITGTASALNIGGNAATATTATNATNIATTATTTNASFYPLFVASSSNGNQAANLDATFTYNPSTDTLTATNFAGNATTATTASTVTTNANLTGAITSVGNATSLGSFTSAQLRTALTNESGTGSAVFNDTPTLVAPLLGTPTSGVFTNCTGLPIVGGTTGTLTETRGGTNQTTYTSGDILYASAANTLSKLAKGTDGQVLTLASGLPSWAAGSSISKYTSADQTITSAGLVSLTHGLGGVPNIIQFFLVCQTAQAGYSINDVIAVYGNSTANGADCFNSQLVTSTTIDVRYNLSGSVFYLQNKTTGAAVALTNANWKLRVFAVRFP